MNKEEYQELRSLITLVTRTREDYQDLRKNLDNRIGRKADGTPTKTAEGRALRPKDLEELCSLSDETRKQEEAAEAYLGRLVERMPIYPWLAEQRGVSTVAIGHICGAFDIYKADTVSKMWQYAGLNPGMVKGWVMEEDPKTKKKTKVRTNTMIRGDRRTAGFLSPFNGNLRTALIGVMAPCIVKSGLRWVPCTQETYDSLPEDMRDVRDKKIDGKMCKDTLCAMEINSPHVQRYIDKKRQYVHSQQPIPHSAKKELWCTTSKGHRNNAAIRYMVKLFVADLYNAWRPLHGLSVRAPYNEEKLGHTYSKSRAA